MINNKVIRNCQVSFPVVQGLSNSRTLGKILIKNLYQGWQGENRKEIQDKHETNPYSLRIGLPGTDEQLKNDRMHFILHYLAYNPITKDIEKRELVSYRNTERVYIGQSLDEKVYSDYRLFVDGKIVAEDIILKRQGISLEQTVINLVDRVEKLQLEIADLKRQLNSRHIYTQGTSNERTN
jgi:hypothetical protein